MINPIGPSPRRGEFNDWGALPDVSMRMALAMLRSWESLGEGVSALVLALGLLRFLWILGDF